MASRKKKEKPAPITTEYFLSILETIAGLNQDIHQCQMKLDQYYMFIKERGINVTVLKKVAAIWESDTRDTFSDYWSKYEEAEAQLPVAEPDELVQFEEDAE